MKVFKRNHYKVHKEMYYKILWATLKRKKGFHKLKAPEQWEIILKKRKKAEKILKNELMIHSVGFALWAIGRVMDKEGIKHKKRMEIFDNINIEEIYNEYYHIVSRPRETDKVQRKLYISETYKSLYLRNLHNKIRK